MNGWEGGGLNGPIQASKSGIYCPHLGEEGKEEETGGKNYHLIIIVSLCIYPVRSERSLSWLSGFGFFGLVWFGFTRFSHQCVVVQLTVSHNYRQEDERNLFSFVKHRRIVEFILRKRLRGAFRNLLVINMYI